jgi:hypothetical protein
LSEALADLTRVSAHTQVIYLIVKLVENPWYRVPGIVLFHGRAAFEQHDAIYILLGRTAF